MSEELQIIVLDYEREIVSLTLAMTPITKLLLEKAIKYGFLPIQPGKKVRP